MPNTIRAGTRPLPRPMTREQLDASGCEIPDCKHEHDDVLFLNALCHPKARSEVSYNKATGNLKVACAFCKKTVAYIAVARASDLMKTGWG